MKVTRILLQSKRMTIEFDNIDDDEKLSFVFRHRKTKDVVQVEGIQDRANNQITLEYKDVDLPEVEFARYDLLVATGEKLIRPRIENKNLSLKKINFDIFYFTSEHYGFRFYFTRDNEVSISRGNYINVEKESKQLRQIEVPIEEVKYVGHKLFIKAFFESPSVKTFIAWKDKKENYILHNGAYFQNVESRSLIEIEKEAFMSIINLEEITPIVVFVKDSILYEGVLRSEKLPKDDQIGNQLSIYHYSKNGNLKLTSNLNLFMTRDNEVSISRGNYINVEKESKQLRQIEVPIEEVKYVGHKLFIKAFFESPSVKTFIAWKDKKENYILHNGAYFQNVESRSLIEIEKEAFMSIINLEEITPIVVFVKDSILYEGVLRSEKLPKDDQIGNQLSIYHYSKNGNLKLTSNLNLFMRKVLNVEKQHCIVKKFSFSEELISIRVNDQVELSNILLFKKTLVASILCQ
ncbi:hypothetical protein ACFSF7_05610 [Ligilactobacillus acidipiscis]|uniref:hypothetical protein n=1 Tax=Ligilactobacillus acidipiscis TaxID=89059 RepID=UPI0036311626